MANHRRLMWALLVASPLACGSESPQEQCGAPEHTTYECEPLPSGSDGCIGGPPWDPRGPQAPVDGAIEQDDPDKIFPVGCYAHVPDCGFYAGGRLFQCVFVSGGWKWGELL